MKSGKSIAVLIANYNMGEVADNWVEHLKKTTKWPIEIIVADNGSENKLRAKHSVIGWTPNLGHAACFNLGFEYIERLERTRGEKFLGYLIISTSTIPISTEDTKDLITPMAKFLLANPDASIVNASHDQNSGTPYQKLFNLNQNGARKVGFVETGFALFRADWFNLYGGFETKFYYNWGTDVDWCFRAYLSGYSVWVHDEVVITKDQDNGFKSNRFEMSANERVMKSSLDMNKVLDEKYGISGSEVLNYLVYGRWPKGKARIKLGIYCVRNFLMRFAIRYKTRKTKLFNKLNTKIDLSKI